MWRGKGGTESMTISGSWQDTTFWHPLARAEGMLESELLSQPFSVLEAALQWHPRPWGSHLSWAEPLPPSGCSLHLMNSQVSKHSSHTLLGVLHFWPHQAWIFLQRPTAQVRPLSNFHMPLERQMHLSLKRPQRALTSAYWRYFAALAADTLKD